MAAVLASTEKPSDADQVAIANHIHFLPTTAGNLSHKTC